MLSPKKNGGWWDLGVSTNASTVCEASELPPSDPAVRKRYAEYAASNFNDHFESGQGVETVFDVLAPLSPRRRWLDVAAGTSTWFWAQAVEGQTEIVLSDIRVEPLRLSERAAASGVFPPAYAGARATCGLPPGALRAALAARRTYAVFDARGSWPSALTGHDLITMIGFCGLRTADEIYTTELDGARAALAPGGCIVGVDWIRSEEFAEWDGHGSSHIGRDVLETRAKRCGLRLSTYKEATIAGDPLYSSLCVWCVTCD